MRAVLLSVLTLPVLLGACEAGTDDPTDTDTDATPSFETLQGIWQATGDSVLYGAGDFGDLGYLAFEPTVAAGGFVDIYAQRPTSGRLVCESGIYTAGTDGVLDVALARDDGDADAYLYERDGDTLTLWNAYAEMQTFTAVDAVPEASVCGSVSAGAEVTFDVEVTSFGNLLFDGTDVRLPTDDGVVKLDLTARTASDTLTYSASYRHQLTMQGTDAWGHCGCGGSEEIVRSSIGGATVDTVDTDALGHRVSVRAAAWDGSHLWVTGYSYDSGATRLLKIDSDAEPDMVLLDIELGDSPQALVASGGVLYGLIQTSVVEMSKTTGMATQTWQLTNEGSYYPFGLTHDGTSLYVGDTTDNGQTRVTRVTLD